MNIRQSVKNNKSHFIISTVSLKNEVAGMMDIMGMGNNDAVGMNYETMVFACNDKGKVTNWADLDKDNYMTEKEAKEGHKVMVKKWKDSSNIK